MFITSAHPADAKEISRSQASGYCNTAGCMTDWHTLLFMDRVEILNILGHFTTGRFRNRLRKRRVVKCPKILDGRQGP